MDRIFCVRLFTQQIVQLWPYVDKTMYTQEKNLFTPILPLFPPNAHILPRFPVCPNWPNKIYPKENIIATGSEFTTKQHRFGAKLTS